MSDKKALAALKKRPAVPAWLKTLAQEAIRWDKSCRTFEQWWKEDRSKKS